MSGTLFRQINENDARASVKAYAKQLAESCGLIADPNPRIFNDASELRQLLTSGAADVISLPTTEFLEMKTAVTGPILTSVVGNVDYEQYVLAVATDSGVTNVSGLKGRQIAVLDNLMGVLAEPWLEVLLSEEKLPPPEAFFSRVSRRYKVAQTVLPVFFHQCDACVVTRQGLDLMGELNPQVAKQLRVVAASPGFVPHLTCFRSGLDSAVKSKIVDAVIQAHSTAAGKQLLTIFQCDRIEVSSTSALQATRDLVAADNGLRSASAPARSVTVADPPAALGGGQ